MAVVRGKHDKKHSYTVISTIPIRSDLSLKALATLLKALDKPDDWTFTKSWWEKTLGSERQIRAVKKELIEKGYCKQVMYRKQGQFCYEYIFYEIPQKVSKSAQPDIQNVPAVQNDPSVRIEPSDDNRPAISYPHTKYYKQNTIELSTIDNVVVSSSSKPPPQQNQSKPISELSDTEKKELLSGLIIYAESEECKSYAQSVGAVSDEEEVRAFWDFNEAHGWQTKDFHYQVSGIRSLYKCWLRKSHSHPRPDYMELQDTLQREQMLDDATDEDAEAIWQMVDVDKNNEGEKRHG